MARIDTCHRSLASCPSLHPASPVLFLHPPPAWASTCHLPPHSLCWGPPASLDAPTSRHWWVWPAGGTAEYLADSLQDSEPQMRLTPSARCQPRFLSVPTHSFRSVPILSPGLEQPRPHRRDCLSLSPNLLLHYLQTQKNQPL